MGRLLKFTAWLLGVLVIVVVAAAILVPMFVNPNDYKPQIVALVKEKTGRNLTLQGNIKLSVFPWLGLQLGPTELSNPPGFSTEPFAKIASTELRVKLLPLLRKRVEMGTVVLDGLVLNLERDKRGKTNWADLGQTKGGAAQPAPSRTKAQSGALPVAALAVGGVRVSDATVRWDDRQSGSRYDVKGLNLTTGAIQPGAPFDVDLRFALTGKGLPAKGVAVKLHSGVKLDLDRQTLDLNKLSLALADLKITGDVAGTQVLSAPRFRAQLDVPAFSPRRLLADLGIAAPMTADPKALDTASAKFTVVSAPDRVQVEPLTVNLDDTRLAGKLGVRNFSHPAISFDLDVNQLDLDRYLPAPRQPARAGLSLVTPAEAAGAPPATGDLPVAGLRALDLDGTLKIASLTAYKLHSSDIRFTVRSRNGDLRVHPATARLYQGTYNGDIGLNASGPVPTLSLNEHLNGVQVGPLVQDLMGVKKISGTGDLGAKLTARGANVARMRSTMNGDARFALKDGALEGVNVVHLVCTAWAIYKQRPITGGGAVAQKTEFGSLTGTATVTNGVVNNNDLLLTSPALRATGSGSANLVTQTLDYGLKATFLNPVQCGGGQSVQELKGLTVPIRISGTFAKPKFRVALEGLLKQKVQSEIRHQIQEKLHDRIPKGLEGLFK